ncbi:MAG: hypothetical protein KC535_05245 [Nanoarchaeota archaeon]|nr:hypothetical protein [Nanoarchaeota archaeon]
MKKLLSVLLALILFLPGVLAVTTHTVRGDLQSFGRGIQAALPPGSSMSGFLDGILGSLPLFGLIVVVFGLMFFVTKVTLFKSSEHDRYARMIAIGIALLGLAQQSVYDAILGLSTSFLILSFLIAVVFMFIMFINHSRKAHLTSHAELHKITGEALNARRDLEKIKHDLKHEQALYAKTEADLAKLSTDLDTTTKLVGSEISQVDRLALMLRKAAASYQSGDSHAVNQYVQALSKDIAGLVTTMQHEQRNEMHFAEMVSQIDDELAKWGHSSDKEQSEEDHLKKLFHHLSLTWGHEIKDDELKKLYKEETDLIRHLRGLRHELTQLESFKDQLLKQTEELEKASYQRKHLEANAVRDNIMNQQFAEAHKHLDELRAIIEYEPHVIKKLRQTKVDMQRHLNAVESQEKQLNQLIKDKMIIALDKLRKESKDAGKKTGTLAGKLSHNLFKVHADLSKYRKHAVGVSSKTHGSRWDEESHGTRVHDLPVRLLSQFTDMEHQFKHLMDEAKEKEKDLKALEVIADKAVTLLKTFQQYLDDSIDVVNDVLPTKEDDYADILKTILGLLRGSKNQLFGEKSALKDLESAIKKEEKK